MLHFYSDTTRTVKVFFHFMHLHPHSLKINKRTKHVVCPPVRAATNKFGLLTLEAQPVRDSASWFCGSDLHTSHRTTGNSPDVSPNSSQVLDFGDSRGGSGADTSVSGRTDEEAAVQAERRSSEVMTGETEETLFPQAGRAQNTEHRRCHMCARGFPRSSKIHSATKQQGVIMEAETGGVFCVNPSPHWPDCVVHN